MRFDNKPSDRRGRLLFALIRAWCLGIGWASLCLMAPSPSFSQGYINPPIYASGYIPVAGGTGVVTNVITVPNHPTDLVVFNTGAITGWTINLPNPTFDGQILTIACTQNASGLALQTSDGSTTPSISSSCTNNLSYSLQFAQRYNSWELIRSSGSGGGTPGGANGSIQYNNGSIFGGYPTSGNGTIIATVNGALSAGDCVNIDVNGNIQDSGGTCGATPGGISGQIQYNNSNAFGGLSTIGSGSLVVKGNSVSGNSGVIGQTSGTLTTGDCAKFDASGNIVDNGSACAGSGTPGGANGSIQYNNSGAFDGKTTVGSGSSVVVANSISGNSGVSAQTSGTLTNGHCVSIDSSGNLVDAGGACSVGGGGGTVSSGTANQLSYYAATGTVVSGTNTVPAITAIPGQEVSVKQFGALGNSNGTHGNGNDDTTAINNAILASNPNSIYFPCGIYRITAQIGSTISGGQYHLRGAGQCSKIYADFTSVASAVLFHSSAGCTNCLEIDHLNFITPNVTGAGMIAIQLYGNFNSRIHNNYFQGYDEIMYYEKSYAPQFIDNWASNIGGSIFATPGGGDVSFNNGQIRGNAIFNSGITDSTPALIFNCGGQLHGQLSVVGNDIELSYAGVEFAGCNGVDFGDNYIENMTQYDFNFAPGTVNSSYHIHDNWFGQAASATLGPVTRGTFEGNEIYNWSITWGSNALGMQVKPTNILVSGSTASMTLSPTHPTVSSCGAGAAAGGGSTRDAGEIIESGSTNTCTVTFELPFLKQPFCVANGGGAQNLILTSISTSGFTVTHNSGANLTWFYYCFGQVE